MKRILFALLCVIGSISGNGQPIVLATYQYADNDRLKNIQPLADHIQKSLGLEVKVKSYPSVHDFINGIQNNEVDIALINTFGYFLLQSSSKNYSMKPGLVLQIAAGAKDNYKTAIISLKSFHADTLTAVKKISAGLRLALVNRGSTSGNLVPRLALSGIGIQNPEKDFAALVDGKNHKATLDSLLSGRADIAAIGSSEYFGFIQEEENRNRIKLLWLSPEIPLGPVLLHDRLSAKTKMALTSLFLQLHANSPSALESVKNGWSEARQAERYISISDSYYLPFRKQLGEENAMQNILTQFAN